MRWFFVAIALGLCTSTAANACPIDRDYSISRSDGVFPTRGVIVVRSDQVFRYGSVGTPSMKWHGRIGRTTIRRIAPRFVRIDYDVDGDAVLQVRRTLFNVSRTARVAMPRSAGLTRSGPGRCQQLTIELDQPVAAMRIRVTQAEGIDEQWSIGGRTVGSESICPSLVGPTVVELFALLADGREQQLNGRVDYASIPVRAIEPDDKSRAGWELDLAVARAALLALLALIFARLALPRVAIGDASLYGHRWSMLFRRLLPRARVVRRRR
jgi:hypothetical protein